MALYQMPYIIIIIMINIIIYASLTKMSNFQTTKIY